MSRGKKILIAAGIVVVLGAIAFANLNANRESGVEINVEKLQKREKQAIVEAQHRIA